MDSCPLTVCHPRRAKRCHLYDKQKGNSWGYCAAKREYFYGLKAHTLIAMSGRPVEVHLSKGSVHDLAGLKEMSLSLSEGATLYDDKAYTNYAYADTLLSEKGIRMLPLRKRVETTFSQIILKLPRRIHAGRASIWESKVLATFVVFAIFCAKVEQIVDTLRVTN